MNNSNHPGKSIIFFISTVLISPVLVVYILFRFFSKSDSLFTGFSQLLSLIPGKTGSYLRVGFYRYTLKLCSKDVAISFLVLFAQQDTEINSGVYIGPNCNIGSCKIGKNTLLGSGVHIMSGKNQHRYTDPDICIKDQVGVLEKISIGEDCWIGNGALILANVGNKCVVGSGSVVTREIPAYSVVAGNPAKIIKSRNI